MLIILLYHRSFVCRYGNSLETLKRHFEYLKEYYPIKLPLEPLVKGQLNVCLSFDDATYDFYYNVYPLLKVYGLKALLSVPVSYIEEFHSEPPEERLKNLSNFSFQRSPPSSAFCSFKELQEMVDSGLVAIASHGMDHVDLSKKDVNLNFELNTSKKILEQRLNRGIDTLVFPYGKYNKQVMTESKSIYKVVMRIGNGLNFSWKGFLHYRVNADQVEDISTLFSKKNRLLYLFNKVLNFLIHNVF